MIRRPPRSPLLPYATLFRSRSVSYVGAADFTVDATAMSGERSVKVASTAGADASWSQDVRLQPNTDRKSTRLNSSHANISYAVFCLKKKPIRVHNEGSAFHL